jgi:hypothetical protein
MTVKTKIKMSPLQAGALYMRSLEMEKEIEQLKLNMATLYLQKPFEFLCSTCGPIYASQVKHSVGCTGCKGIMHWETNFSIKPLKVPVYAAPLPTTATELMLDAGMVANDGNIYVQDMYYGPRAMLQDRYAAMINVYKNQ